jgi:hypothetical protein
MILTFLDVEIRHRRRDLLIAALRWAAVLAVLIVFLAVVDLVVSWSAATRWVLLLALAVLTIRRLYRPALAGLGRANPLTLARSLEFRAALPTELLQTLVSHHHRPVSGVSEPLIAELSRRLNTHVSAHPLPKPRRRTSAAVLCFASITLAAIMLAHPDGRLLSATLRVLLPWQDRSPVQAVTIVLLPGDASIPQGSTLTLVANIDPTPEAAIPVLLETSRDGYTFAAVEMAPRGAAGFLHVLTEPQYDLVYRVRVGGTLSPVHRITVITSPAVSELSFTAADARPLPVRDNIVNAFPGERFTLRLRATESLDSATLIADTNALSANPATLDLRLDPGDPATASLELSMPTVSTSYQLRLRSRRGGASISTLQLRPAVGAPPEVRILRPAAGALTGPRDDLDISLAASDDLGLAVLWVELASESATITRIPVPVPAAARSLTTSVRLPLTPLALPLGSRLTLTAVARDLADTEQRSAPVVLTLSAAAPDPLTTRRFLAVDTAHARLAAARNSLATAADALDRSTTDSAILVARYALTDASEHLAAAQRGLAQAVQAGHLPAFADAIESIAANLASTQHTTDLALALDSDRGDDLKLSATRLRQSRDALGPAVKSLTTLRQSDAASLFRSSPQAIRDVSAELTFDAASARAAVSNARALFAQPHPAATAPTLTPDLPARLDAAWRIESLRPDSLPRRAADLNLAARAAEQLLRKTRPADPTFTADLLTLLQSHRAARTPGLATPTEAELADARRRLMATAEAGGGAGGGHATLARLSELANSTEAAASPLLASARTQRQLTASIERLTRPIDSRTATGLADSLSSLLDSLPQGNPTGAGSPNPRVEAVRAISAAELRLGDLTAAAARYAELARSPESALAAVRAAADSVAVARSDAVRDELVRYVPELAQAAATADQTLRPALEALARANSHDELTAAAGKVADAVTALQLELADARSVMTLRDPIAVARASLAASISALRNPDPDPQTVTRLTQAASGALDAAAREQLRPLRDAALADLTELAPMLREEAAGSPPTPAARTVEPDLSAVPEAYRPAVRTYFRRLREGENK